METATVVTISIAFFLICITAFSIYTAFGPPSKQLDDPFEDHPD
ncbi:MAG: photosystem II reaction center protein PsbN [Hormoscilla sp. GM102CHS1]|nr:photosystem II reaction center protein PsbN [Hormoscilla sp. GM102CHS1]